MAETSHISWTDATWNPVLGCDKVSAGCANCYAVGVAHRMAANPNTKIAAANAGLTQVRTNGQRDWTGLVRCLPERLRLPLTWKEPRRIFVNSLSDLFHDEVPMAFIDQVFAVMALCPQHVFQVLTKRPERMQEYFATPLPDWRVIEAMQLIETAPWRRLNGQTLDLTFDDDGHIGEIELRWPLPNVWLGVSVENQKAADARIPLLLQTPAAVRWLSCEPLLGPVDLQQYLCDFELGRNNNTRGNLHWIVCGGESSYGARPMHPNWARSLRDQCQSAGVPFHFKQVGEWAWSVPAGEHGEPEAWINPATAEVTHDETIALAGGRWQGVWRVGKKAAGRLLEGKEYDAFPEVC